MVMAVSASSHSQGYVQCQQSLLGTACDIALYQRQMVAMDTAHVAWDPCSTCALSCGLGGS